MAVSVWHRSILRVLSSSPQRNSPLKPSRDARFRPILEELETRLAPAIISFPNWNSIGPDPITGARNVQGPTPATTQEVGAVNAIAVDPGNANHLFAATVNGGIWQTNDFTVANPTWTTTTDHMPSLSMASIAFSPTNDQVIYAGTGSYSATSGDAFTAGQGGPAVGVYKSIDGGASWQVLNPNNMFSGLRVFRIIPTALNGGQTIFLATTDSHGAGTGGVYRSDDGGSNWMRLSGANGLPDRGVTDLVANPANGNQYFAAVSRRLSVTPGVFRLDLGVGTNWQNVTNNIAGGDLNTVGADTRIELSVSPAGANPVWATFITSGGFYQRVYRGVPAAGTINWAQVGPLVGGVRQPPDVFTGNQGTLHGAVVADPNSDTLVYVAGDTQGNFPFSGYIARGDSAANTWTAITPTSPPSGNPGTVVPTNAGVTTSPHADSRNLVFDGGLLLEASDGGVYQCTNPAVVGVNQQTWTSLDGSLADTEFYFTTVDNQGQSNPANDLIAGGAQDNDTSERSTAGVWVGQSSGDGVAVLADPTSNTRYYSSQNYFMASTGPGGPALPQMRAGLTSPAGVVAGTGGDVLNSAAPGTQADTFPFIPIFQINRGDIANGVNPARLILAGNLSGGQTLYVSADQAQNYTSIGGVIGGVPQGVAGLGAGSVLVIAFGDTVNRNVCYVGTSAGDIARTNNITVAGGGFALTSFSAVAGGELPQDMVIDPNDPLTLYVVTETGVFVTNDGGTMWTNITDNLGALFSPGFKDSINAGLFRGRSIELFNNGTPTKADDVLLVGGPGGVFRRPVQPPACCGNNTWELFGAQSTLPNILVNSLQYDARTDVLLASSFGRGAWLLTSASAAITAVVPPQVLGLTVSPTTINEGDTVTLSGTIATNQPTNPFSVTVNWGDGTGNTTLAVAPGVFTFSTTHRYLNNLPVGQASGALTILVSVSNPCGVTGTARTTVTVNNVPPTLSNVTATSPLQVGGTTTLTGRISDRGPQDTFTLQINWGDGTPAQSLHLPAGSTSFSATHAFNNAGSFTILVTVFDDDNASATASTTVVVLSGVYAVGSDAGLPTQVKVYDSSTNALKFTLSPFGGFTGGARVAAGDVNGDGMADIIVGAGPGGLPQINIYDGNNGQLIRAFFGLFPNTFTGGVFVAAGDVNGDGFADVIVGADAGGGPEVCVWNGKDGSLLDVFNAFPGSFTGGVRVGAGDVNGDGKADIIAGAGPGGLPQVTVYSGANLAILQSFFAFPESLRGGVYVAGDTLGRIIVGAGAGGLPEVTIFDGRSGAVVQSFFAYPALPTDVLTFTGVGQGGVRVGSTTVRGNEEILTAPAPGPEAAALVEILDGNSLALLDRFYAFDPAFKGGVFVGG